MPCIGGPGGNKEAIPLERTRPILRLRCAQDRLALNAINFLTTVARSVHFALFKDPATLRQVCESIVIPNLRMRPDDKEMFEMNWVEYVRRDTEGSDSDTRRRAASELVKALTERFPTEVGRARSRPAPPPPLLCPCCPDAE